MPRVHFRVSYSIPDGKRPEYLAAIGALRKHFGTTDVQYGVFESKGKHNHFQEVYIYPSVEAYEASDDPDTNTEIAGAMDKIYALATDVTYDVAFEVG
jgi:hypothetical protein